MRDQGDDDTRPAFIITIDTEGDNFWARQAELTTHNARHLPKFQALCERHGLKPTYLTDYEMAIDEAYQDFARDAVARGQAEVGMHLHAWNTPPLGQALTFDDNRTHPYLIEYDLDGMRAKVDFMTDLIEDAFARKVTSHRAGRWSFDERYAGLLAARGYTVDCSVTPHVSWASNLGDPAKGGGSDFRHAPEHAYLIDPRDVTRPGAGPLIEVPMTVVPRHLSQRALPGVALANKWGQRLSNQLLPNDWLRPRRGNLATMMSVVRRCLREGRPYAMFMTHSSELMPGGSPYFPDEASSDACYRDLDQLFGFVSAHFRGMTLSEYAAAFAADAQPAVAA